MSSKAGEMAYSYSDEQQFKLIAYKWTEAVDTKNWELLRSICAPQVRNMYSKVGSNLPNEPFTAESYVNFWSSKSFLGDERLKTQHLLGTSYFELQDGDHATGKFQIKVTHHRTFADGRLNVWDPIGYTQFYFDRIDGKWKFGGAMPSVISQVGKMSDVFGDFPEENEDAAKEETNL